MELDIFSTPYDEDEEPVTPETEEEREARHEAAVASMKAKLPKPCQECTAPDEYAGLDPCYGCRYGHNPEEAYERFLETGRGQFHDDEAEELARYPHKAFDPQGIEP